MVRNGPGSFGMCWGGRVALGWLVPGAAEPWGQPQSRVLAAQVHKASPAHPSVGTKLRVGSGVSGCSCLRGPALLKPSLTKGLLACRPRAEPGSRTGEAAGPAEAEARSPGCCSPALSCGLCSSCPCPVSQGSRFSMYPKPTVCPGAKVQGLPEDNCKNRSGVMSSNSVIKYKFAGSTFWRTLMV